MSATIDILKSSTVVKVTKARSTATVVVLIDNRDQRYSDGGLPWHTVCVAHGGDCGFDTRAAAQSYASAPEEWCDGCCPQ